MIESDLGEQMANKVFHAWKNISFELIFSSDINVISFFGLNRQTMTASESNRFLRMSAAAAASYE